MSQAWSAWLAGLDRQKDATGTVESRALGTVELRAIGTVVHVGAGIEEALATLEAGRAARIVLVTCDPDEVAEVQRAMRRDARLDLVRATLGAETGEAEWRDLGVPHLSGLARPTALRELFPGLTETGRRRVQTRTLDDILAPLDLMRDPARLDVLRLDILGSEHLAIAQLAALPDLPFDYLCLRAQAAPLYEGAVRDTDLLAQLDVLGFRVIERRNEDPDLPEYWLRREPLFHEVRDLRDTLRDTESALSASRDDLAATRRHLDSAQRDTEDMARRETELVRQIDSLSQARDVQNVEVTDLQEALSARDAEVASQADIIAVREAEIGRITGLLEVGEAEISSQSEAAAVRDAEMLHQIDGLRAELDTLRQAETEQSAEIAALRRHLAEREALIAAGTRREADLVGELEALHDENKALRHALQDAGTQAAQDREAARNDAETLRQSTAEAVANARADATLALRMQALQAADLQALQRRHEALRAEKHEQDDLLRRVTARLTQAAEHVRQLDLAEALPGLGGDAVSADPNNDSSSTIADELAADRGLDRHPGGEAPRDGSGKKRKKSMRK